jgi:hypothetical protein
MHLIKLILLELEKKSCMYREGASVDIPSPKSCPMTERPIRQRCGLVFNRGTTIFEGGLASRGTKTGTLAI